MFPAETALFFMSAHLQLFSLRSLVLVLCWGGLGDWPGKFYTNNKPLKTDIFYKKLPPKKAGYHKKNRKTESSKPTICSFFGWGRVVFVKGNLWVRPHRFRGGNEVIAQQTAGELHRKNPRVPRDHPKRSKHCDNVRQNLEIPKKKFVIQLNINTVLTMLLLIFWRFLSKHYNFTTQLSCIASSHCPPAVLNGGDKKQLHLWQQPRQEDCVFPQVAATQRDILGRPKKSFQTATQYLSVWSIQCIAKYKYIRKVCIYLHIQTNVCIYSCALDGTSDP